MGKGRKSPENNFSRKQKINPVWFPFYPPVYDVESRLFFDILMGPKTSRTIPMGEGTYANQDKRKDGEGRGEEQDNINYSNVGPRSSESWGWQMVKSDEDNDTSHN